VTVVTPHTLAIWPPVETATLPGLVMAGATPRAMSLLATMMEMTAMAQQRSFNPTDRRMEKHATTTRSSLVHPLVSAPWITPASKHVLL